MPVGAGELTISETLVRRAPTIAVGGYTLSDLGAAADELMDHLDRLQEDVAEETFVVKQVAGLSLVSAFYPMARIERAQRRQGGALE